MRRFREWSESIRSAFEASTSLGTWLATAAIAGLMVFAASWVPGIKEYFRLRPSWAMAAFAVAMVLDLTSLQLRRRGDGMLVIGALSLVGSAFLQMFSGLLMVSSSAWGAAVFSSTLLLTALYHGYLHRSSLPHPYQALASLAAVGATAALCPTRQHLAIVLVSGPVAVFGSLVFGTIAVRTARLRAESESLRAAVAAQIAREESTRAGRLANTLERMSMWNHDMRNSVTVASCHARLLERLGPEDFSTPEARATLREGVAGIRKGIDSLCQGLDDTRELARQHRAEVGSAEEVEVPLLAEAVASAAKVRFPGVRIGISSEGQFEDLRALVNGGKMTLQRALENLVLNACEGDGERGARNVALGLAASGRFLQVEVADDGPGFSAEQLQRPITGFETTKAHGTGLGLYTVDHLVTASGGTLARSNRETGGARVTLRLPRKVEA